MKFRMTSFRVALVTTLATLALSATAYAGQPQQPNDILGQAAKIRALEKGECAHAQTVDQVFQCEKDGIKPIASIVLLGAAALAMPETLLGLGVRIGLIAGDTVATDSYNYVNSSTSKALGNLGNDSSEQGSYLWNAEHQPDPTEQRRQEMQDAMAAQGIYDDTPANAAK